MDAFMIRIPVPLAITSGRSGDLVTITLDGELDVGNVGLLDGTIRVAEKEDCKKILVDLQELSFIDSSGLELLLEARCRSRTEEVLG